MSARPEESPQQPRSPNPQGDKCLLSKSPSELYVPMTAGADNPRRCHPCSPEICGKPGPCLEQSEQSEQEGLGVDREHQ